MDDRVSKLHTLPDHVSSKLATLNRQFEHWIDTVAAWQSDRSEQALADFTERVKQKGDALCRQAEMLTGFPMQVVIWSKRGEAWVAFYPADEPAPEPSDFSGLLYGVGRTV